MVVLPEAELIQMLNAERERAGLEPLQVHWDLEDDARRQAQRMRSEGRTSSIEDISSVTVGWTSLRQYAAFVEPSGSPTSDAKCGAPRVGLR